ncbi:hypothetical protein HPP92_014456 [Vanilla planifolia]|uniref:Senescence regulator n=1 Tax=Vanilla planifolia TaxID=51239 RepID=A0A835UR46_VANPL|nr:hypothetical protein HPP92_014456 [Vanilla planifolia]
MAEEATQAASLLPYPFSSTFHFLRFDDHPNCSPTRGPHFEIDETDVFWSPDLTYNPEDESPTSSIDGNSSFNASGRYRFSFPTRDTTPMLFSKSAPLDVPKWPKGMAHGMEEEKEDGDEDEATERSRNTMNMVPPHVMVARSHETTSSVLEGVGRTLKGRDLRRVRNAVFRKTGFLDSSDGCV